MATSGTYAFNLDLSDILEEAYEMAGLELRSGYDYRTARRSLDLMFLEWQNKGLNLWTVQEGSQTLTAGTGRYALAGDQLDVIEASLRTDDGDADKQSDLTMSRISISQYSHLTNKLTHKINYYYIQRVEDSGSPASNNVDIPARFMPCMAAGLAYYISIKRPEASERAPLLKQVYDEQWNLAADADRDKSSFYMVPGGYNRV